MAEYDGYNNLKYNYIYGNGQKLASINTGGAKEYFHNDYLGSVRRVSTQSGSAPWRRDYYPFGETREATGANEENFYTYEGKEKDLETDLWNNWNRHFNDKGRFTQVDPLWSKYPSLSPYVRVANNPLRFVDEDGESIGIVVGAISGGIYGYKRSMDLIGGEVSNQEEALQVLESTVGSSILGAIAGSPDYSGIFSATLAVGASEVLVQKIITGKVDVGKVGQQMTKAAVGATVSLPIGHYLLPDPTSGASTVFGGYIMGLFSDSDKKTEPSNYVEIENEEDLDDHTK